MLVMIDMQSLKPPQMDGLDVLLAVSLEFTFLCIYFLQGFDINVELLASRKIGHHLRKVVLI